MTENDMSPAEWLEESYDATRRETRLANGGVGFVRDFMELINDNPSSFESMRWRPPNDNWYRGVADPYLVKWKELPPPAEDFTLGPEYATAAVPAATAPVTAAG